MVEEPQNQENVILSTTKKPRKEKTLYYPPNYKQFKKLMSFVNDKRHRIAFLLCWCAGLRVAEALRLKQDQIDLDKSEVRVIAGKNLKDGTSAYVAWEDWQKLTDEDITLLPLNNHVKKNTLQKAFRRYVTKAGLDEVRKQTAGGKNKHSWSIHVLRHGYGVNLIDDGNPLNVVQSMLRHNNIQTTSAYTELNPKAAIESVKMHREKNRK